MKPMRKIARYFTGGPAVFTHPRQGAALVLAQLAAIVVLAAAGFGISLLALRYWVAYEYSSSAVIYVCEPDAGQTAGGEGSLYQTLMGNMELSRDFTAFVTSEGGFSQLQENLSAEIPWLAEYRYDPGKYFVEANKGEQSRIISLTVTCGDPSEAVVIANECVRLLGEMSELVFGKNYTQLLQAPEANPVPTSPKKALVLGMGAGCGALVGLLAAVAGARGRARRLERKEEAAPPREDFEEQGETGTVPDGREVWKAHRDNPDTAVNGAAAANGEAPAPTEGTNRWKLAAAGLHVQIEKLYADQNPAKPKSGPGAKSAPPDKKQPRTAPARAARHPGGESP